MLRISRSWKILTELTAKHILPVHVPCYFLGSVDVAPLSSFTISTSIKLLLTIERQLENLSFYFDVWKRNHSADHNSTSVNLNYATCSTRSSSCRSLQYDFTMKQLACRWQKYRCIQYGNDIVALTCFNEVQCRELNVGSLVLDATYWFNIINGTHFCGYLLRYLYRKRFRWNIWSAYHIFVPPHCCSRYNSMQCFVYLQLVMSTELPVLTSSIH